MENIKDALEYAVELASWENKVITNEDGKEYYDAKKYDLQELTPKRYPTAIQLNTLTSLVNYLLSGLNELSEQNLIVLVDNPKEVYVYTEDDERATRTTLAKVRALVPDFNYGSYYDVEQFNIALQSKFKDEGNRETVIDYASAIVIDQGAEVEDDGISQVTTVRNGVASKGKAIAPNPVLLTPYRTFNEVEQPASNFVFRINKEAKLALFEADGGAWRLDAIQNVAEYLQLSFADRPNITVLA